MESLVMHGFVFELLYKNENEEKMFSVTNFISFWATVVVFNSNT